MACLFRYSCIHPLRINLFSGYTKITETTHDDAFTFHIHISLSHLHRHTYTQQYALHTSPSGKPPFTPFWPCYIPRFGRTSILQRTSGIHRDYTLLHTVSYPYSSHIIILLIPLRHRSLSSCSFPLEHGWAGKAGWGTWIPFFPFLCFVRSHSM